MVKWYKRIRLIAYLFGLVGFVLFLGGRLIEGFPAVASNAGFLLILVCLILQFISYGFFLAIRLRR